jgi:putative SOS response-associated peptidase YedK
MKKANVLHLDAEGNRTMTRMLWSFPKPPRPDGKYVQPHIHARGETIDEKELFQEPFARRRGTLIVHTFNEGHEVSPSKTIQHTITPDDGKPIGIAVIWSREAQDDGDLYRFVMVTVAANKLISTITKRMPAIIQPGNWGEWLGEERASPEELKALLRPYEGKWTMRLEAKKAKPPKVPPANSSPTLF